VIRDHRVVAWTPYGREETVAVLARYLRREHERGLVDEWWLCMNTDPGQVSDIAFAQHLASFYPWIKLVYRPDDCPRLVPKQRNTGFFYRYMTDPDTVFLRLDDDIIYIHEDAVDRLVVHRLEAQHGVASFPVMWNNSIISWYLQQAGNIPAEGTDAFLTQQGLSRDANGAGIPYTWPRVGGPFCMDPVGWADGRFGVALHRLLLEWLDAGTPERAFLYQDMPLQVGTQFSVSTFTSLGRMYRDLPAGPGILRPDEEESWHTVHEPRRIGEGNTIVGNALVSHFTFFPQGPIIRATDILDRYRLVADKFT
jgi:hypothetical protein